MGFEPTPFRTGALSQRLRPLGQTVLGLYLLVHMAVLGDHRMHSVMGAGRKLRMACNSCCHAVMLGERAHDMMGNLAGVSEEARKKYTWPGSNWRPSACEADVIATRPQVRVTIECMHQVATHARRARAWYIYPSFARSLHLYVPPPAGLRRTSPKAQAFRWTRRLRYILKIERSRKCSHTGSNRGRLGYWLNALTN